MAALNWAMLTPQGQPVPLPHEKWLFSSSPGTVAISLFPHPPGSPLNVEPKPADTHYRHQHGTLYLSQKRVVYVAPLPPSSTSSRRHLPSGGTATSHTHQGSHASSSTATLPPAATTSTIPTPPSTAAASKGPASLESLSVPLRAFVDGRLVQPWFSANYYEAVCLEGDGSGGLEGPHLVRFSFKEGGAPDFYSAVEEVKARAELSSARRGTPVEQLPAYEPPPPSSLAHPPHSPRSSSPLAQSPSPPRTAPPRTAPSDADLAAARIATAADESEQLARDERCAAQGGPPPGLEPAAAGIGADEAPPGYDEAQGGA